MLCPLNLRGKKASRIYKFKGDRMRKNQIKKTSILIITFIAAIISAHLASASVVINQILYDPINSESDGEAVELYNTGSISLDISGWVLKTESSSADATIPQNTTIQPHSFYLIADAGFSTGKDNSSWPNANLEEEISLTNTNAGAAIIANATIVDAVGWGNRSLIDDGLYEGAPAVHVQTGKCLVRTANGNSNADDFEERDCIFGSARLSNSSNEIEINLSVGEGGSGNGDSDVSIDSVMIKDDDNLTAGVQVMPSPGAMKSVNITVVASGTNRSSITAELFTNFSLNKSSQIDATTAVYSGNAEIEYYREPGNYNITIIVGDERESKGFYYMPLLSLEVSSPALSLSADAGESISSLSNTVRNIGNIMIDVGVSGTDLTSSDSRVIPVSSIEYSLSSDFSPVSYNLQTLDTNIECGINETEQIRFRINVPEDAGGNYRGTITLVAVSS
jgi:hypothetical protein